MKLQCKNSGLSMFPQIVKQELRFYGQSKVLPVHNGFSEVNGKLHDSSKEGTPEGSTESLHSHDDDVQYRSKPHAEVCS